LARSLVFDGVWNNDKVHGILKNIDEYFGGIS